MTAIDPSDLDAGRALVRANLWRILWLSAFVSWLALRIPDAPRTEVWGRLAILLLVCVLVYRGARWALWLLGFLTVPSALALLTIALAAPRAGWTARVLYGVSGAVQLLAFLIVVRAPEAREFLATQRLRRDGLPDAEAR